MSTPTKGSNKQPSPQSYTAARGSNIKAQTEQYKVYSRGKHTPATRGALAYFTLPLAK